jgi:hypothetical protein
MGRWIEWFTVTMLTLVMVTIVRSMLGALPTYTNSPRSTGREITRSISTAKG